MGTLSVTQGLEPPLVRTNLRARGSEGKGIRRPVFGCKVLAQSQTGTEVLNSKSGRLNRPSGGEGTRRPIFGRKILAQSQIGTQSPEDREL